MYGFPNSGQGGGNYSSFRRFKPDFDYLLPLRLPYFAPLRETKTVVHLPEIRCNDKTLVVRASCQHKVYLTQGELTVS